MRPWIAPVLPILLLACETPEEPASAAPDVCTDNPCLDAGLQPFSTPDGDRTLHVFLPDDPEGAPVLFVWHHLGGSTAELLEWMPVDRATQAGFIVVAPASRALPATEWDLDPGSNADLDLFDAVLDVLITQYDVPERAYTTGFSAGGLFSTLLTLHRSERLAGSAPFSGGAPAGSYRSPTSDIPVMLSWGGASDVIFGFDFDGATRFAASALRDDGHVVLTCDHGLGHWLPADAADRTIRWFEGLEAGTTPDFAGCTR